MRSMSGYFLLASKPAGFTSRAPTVSPSLFLNCTSSVVPSDSAVKIESFTCVSARSAPFSKAYTSPERVAVAVFSTTRPVLDASYELTARRPSSSRVTVPPATGTAARCTARSSPNRKRRLLPSVLHDSPFTSRSSVAATNRAAPPALGTTAIVFCVYADSWGSLP